MFNMKSLIITPTYNEKENIPELIPEILKLKQGFHILIVDDNSTDGTRGIADQLAQKYPEVFVLHRESKRGLGRAYIDGFKWALDKDYGLIFEMDADFSHQPQALPEFLEAIKNCDLVIGSRYLNGIRIVNWPLSRLVISLVANKYIRMVTGLKLRDCTTGFKCFRRKVLESIDLDKINSDGYSFQFEMNYIAQKKGFKIGEIPITFIERQAGTSKMTKKIVWEAIWRVWKLRFSK